MSNIFLTSDLHLSHIKSFLWEPRGFTNVEEMNKLSEKITAAMPELKNEAAASEVLAENDDSAFAKMKRMVRKAVNCCIE